jgi:hypothetical protein
LAQLPHDSPYAAANELCPFARISTNETYNITPAEKPVVTERKRKLVREAIKAIALPMAVANPAKRVIANAIPTLLSILRA